VILKRPVKLLFWTVGFAVAGAALAPAAILSATGRRDTAMRLWFGWLLRVLSVRVTFQGTLPPPGSLVVLNHESYIDILAVGWGAPGSFVAKSEIAGWPLLGGAARIGRTLFVDRTSPRNSHKALTELAERLGGGERVILFAEGGIVGEGCSVAPFRPMFFEAGLRAGARVVPAAIRYLPEEAREPMRWRDGGVLSHLFTRVFPAKIVRAEIAFAPPLDPLPGEDRRALAARSRAAVCALLGEAPGE